MLNSILNADFVVLIVSILGISIIAYIFIKPILKKDKKTALSQRPGKTKEPLI